FQPDKIRKVAIGLFTQEAKARRHYRRRAFVHVGNGVLLGVVTAAAVLVELLERAAAIVVAATVVLVEGHDREALGCGRRGNDTSNKGQGDESGKKDLHGHLRRFALCNRGFVPRAFEIGSSSPAGRPDRAPVTNSDHLLIEREQSNSNTRLHTLDARRKLGITPIVVARAVRQSGYRRATPASVLFPVDRGSPSAAMG